MVQYACISFPMHSMAWHVESAPRPHNSLSSPQAQGIEDWTVGGLALFPGNEGLCFPEPLPAELTAAAELGSRPAASAEPPAPTPPPGLPPSPALPPQPGFAWQHAVLCLPGELKDVMGLTAEVPPPSACQHGAAAAAAHLCHRLRPKVGADAGSGEGVSGSSQGGAGRIAAAVAAAAAAGALGSFAAWTLLAARQRRQQRGSAAGEAGSMGGVGDRVVG